MPVSGLIAAPHTPLDASGRVNRDAIRHLAEFLLANGIDGLFVCGTTGEGLSLTRAEREAVAEEWARAVNGRVSVIVHVGCAAEAEAVDLARHAGRTAGVTSMATVAPFYHRAGNLDDLVRHFGTLAAAAPQLPLYLYDIPAVTRVNIATAQFVALAAGRIPTFAGVKFSNPDLVVLQESLGASSDRVDILFGIDEMLLAALALGVRGAVGSTYNFALPLYRRLIAAFQAGDLATARRLQLRSVEMVRILERFGGLAAGKAVMGLLGIDCGPVRGPLRSLDASDRDALRSQLDAIGFFAPEFCSRAF